MTRLRHSSRVILCGCSVIALLAAPLHAQQQPAGVVTGLQGKAQLTRSATPSPLHYKDGVIIRDIVDTREKSMARILFGGRSTVTVRELSRLEVREELLPTGARRDVYELNSGGILVNVARQLMRPGDEVIIRTPNAVAAVRGTAVFVQYNSAANQSTMTVLSGQALVQGQLLGPNAQATISGTDVTFGTITPAEAEQILSDSQIGGLPTSEDSQGQTDLAMQLAGTIANITGGPTNGSQPGGVPGGTDQPPDTGTQGCLDCTNVSETADGVSSPPSFPLAPPGTLFIADDSLTVAGNLFELPAGAIAVQPDSLLIAIDAVLNIGGSALVVGGSLTGPPVEPLFDTDPTTITTAEDFFHINPTGSVALTAPMHSDIGGTLIIGGDFLEVEGGGSLTNPSVLPRYPLYVFSGTTAAITGDLIKTGAGSAFALNGPALAISGGEIAATNIINLGAPLTTPGGQPLLQVSSGQLGAANSLGLLGANLTLGGAFLAQSGGAVSAGGVALTVAGNQLTSGQTPVFDITGGTLTVNRLLTASAGSAMDLGTTLLTGGPGTTITGTGALPFIEFTDSTASIGTDLAVLDGATLNTAGSFLKTSGGSLTLGDSSLLVLTGGANFTAGGSIFDVTDLALDLGGDAVMEIAGGSMLANTAGPVAKIAGGSLIADALVISDGAANVFNLTGSVLDLADTTVTLRVLGDATGESDTDTATFNLGPNEPFIKMSGSTFNLTGEGEELVSFGVDEGAPITQTGVALIATGAGENPSAINVAGAVLDLGGVNLTDTNPQIQLTDTTVDQTGGDSFIQVFGLPVTVAGPLLKSTDSTISTPVNLLQVGGTLTGTSVEPLLLFDPATTTASGNFIFISPGATLSLQGPLMTDEGGTFNVGPEFVMVSGSLQSTTGQPLLQLDGSTVTTSAGIFTSLVDSGATQLAGPLLLATNANMTTGIDILILSGGATLNGTSSDALYQLSGGSVTTDRLFRFEGGSSAVLSGPLFHSSGATVEAANMFLNLSASHLTSATTTPFIRFENSVVAIGTDLLVLDGGGLETTGPLVDIQGGTLTLGASSLLNLSNGASLTTGGTVFDFTNLNLDLGEDAAVGVSGGSSLNNTAGPFTKIAGGSLIADALVSTDGNGNFFNLAGSILDLTDATVTLRVIKDVPEGSTDIALFNFVANEPVIKLSSSSLNLTGEGEPAVDFQVNRGVPVPLTGVALIATGTPENPSTINVADTLLDLGGLNLTDTIPQIQLTNTTVTQTGDSSIIEVSGLPVTVAGPLLKATESAISTEGGLLSVRGSLAGLGTAPLIQIDPATITTGDDLIDVGLGGSLSLRGVLLADIGSTFHIGADSTASGDLVDIGSGGVLVMNTADPVLELSGGAYTIGTVDGSGDSTPNRVFRLQGVNIDADTGLGADQVIKGNGIDPLPFDGAANPIGTLLRATDGATIEVKAGPNDAESGGVFPGNAVRFDTMLFEAVLPVIHLIGTGTTDATATKLTTDGDALDIFRSRVVSLGPVVDLDNGLIHVTNGAFLTLTSGSNWDVTGDLLRLANGSKIEVVNGPLIRVMGTSGTESNTGSTLNVSGALANFAASGGNQIVVNNAIAPTATLSGLPVHTDTGGSVSIGPNPIINPGLGSITINGTPTGPEAGPFTGSLIQATDNGAVNITAPAQ